ncbi:MAG: hypothetical protein A3I00_05355 [Betaproteobacteria bacterium RIFCSPLOWO2_02_FULL_64_12]|nr:MAG: hypothetical protein A3I00_05355 [Betaproteobacteria bacterium RIFCSPLOWO2_02_FULL_64_12]
MGPVFVTDGWRRKALAVVRSLGRAGIRVVVGDTGPIPFAALSRYCGGRARYPSPSTSPDKFAVWLAGHLEQGGYRVCMPLDDDTLEVVLHCRHRLPASVALPFVGQEAFLLARDKASTFELATVLGVPCPATVVPGGPEDLDGVSGQLRFPVLVKPRRSLGSRGIRYVATPEELPRAYLDVHRRFPRPIVQECLPRSGPGLGVSALFNSESELRAVFVHRRIREFPLSGGPSTCRVSVEEPELAETAVRLLKALRWIGVAMVEFKVDLRDGVTKFLEINPRFWGSLPLAIAAGVDFPLLLYRLATEGDVEPVRSYEVGLLGISEYGDLLHLIRGREKGKILRSLLSLDRRTVRLDTLAWDDPLPFFGYPLTRLIGRLARR